MQTLQAKRLLLSQTNFSHNPGNKSSWEETVPSEIHQWLGICIYWGIGNDSSYIGAKVLHQGLSDVSWTYTPCAPALEKAGCQSQSPHKHFRNHLQACWWPTIQNEGFSNICKSIKGWALLAHEEMFLTSSRRGSLKEQGNAKFIANYMMLDSGYL